MRTPYDRPTPGAIGLLACVIPLATLAMLTTGCGPTSTRGTWAGALVAIPPHGAAAAPLAGLDVAPGPTVAAAYQRSATDDTPALLVDRRGRAIGYDTIAHLGARIAVTGRMTYANVKTSDGSGWICGPPPRGPWDSHLTCWVIEVETTNATDDQREEPAGVPR